METEHYAILYNLRSGKGAALRVLPDFEDYLRKKQISFEVFSETPPKTLTGFSCLVVMGGDGSANFAINHFGAINIPIAFLRCGTGNDYNTLHLGRCTQQQEFEIATGNRMVVADAGTCNGRRFINGVGIGFDGWVVKRNLGKRFFSGQLAYLATIVSLLLFYKERVTEVEIDGEKTKRKVFMLSIAKGRTYGGGFKVAPQANPTDGFLDVITVYQIGLFNRFRYLPVIDKGGHLNLPFVSYKKGKHVRIASETLLQAHLDGEWLESKTFDIEVLPKAYKIKSIL